MVAVSLKKIFFKQKTAYEIEVCLVGSEMCIRDRINIGAYDFRPMFDKSIYHTTPEEALEVAKDLKSKRVLGTHWGTFVLSLEPILEPPKRFKRNAKSFGFNEDDALISVSYTHLTLPTKEEV